MDKQAMTCKMHIVQVKIYLSQTEVQLQNA